jgi:hypothetical protein
MPGFTPVHPGFHPGSLVLPIEVGIWIGAACDLVGVREHGTALISGPYLVCDPEPGRSQGPAAP